ncbi:ATP-binding protein [Frankia sp. ACN1ag]|uniref:sensor histidine kinase n=1 Tax=Frankia sp. ACN1ag TaxID=102891 RepID=UPI000AC3327C|nr:ATP-binding protein [Frankia sp. ACN1ag]
MPGAPQRSPRQLADPDLAALIEYRHDLHRRHPVPADQIARWILPDDPWKNQRSLSRKILRLFQDGIGKSSAQWIYFQGQIQLGVPPEERDAALDECGRLYRKAFPQATDCPYPAADPVAAGFDPLRIVIRTQDRLLENALHELRQMQALLEETRWEARTREAGLSAAIDSRDHILEVGSRECDRAHREAAAARDALRAATERAAGLEEEARALTAQKQELAAQVAELAVQMTELADQVQRLRQQVATPADRPGHPAATTCAVTVASAPEPPAAPEPEPPAASAFAAVPASLAAVPASRPAFDAPLPAGGWLPRGLPLADWKARHILVCWILALHLPLIAGYACYQGASVGHALVAALPPLLLLAAAGLPGGPRIRTLAAGAGLLCSSTILMFLAGGACQLVLHFVVVTALLALYEDWTTHLLGLPVVFIADPVVRHTVAGGRDPFGPVWIVGGFVVALTGVQLVLRRHGEQSRQRAAHYRGQLYEGQESLMARIEETDRLRSELVTTVSHEFRAPLAGIRATLATLRSERDRLSDARIDELLDDAAGSSRRLHRLLENMLTAATATAVVDDDVRTDLPSVLAEVVETLRAAVPARASSVIIDAAGRLPVRMAHGALHQLVTNLLDNAATYAQPGAPIRLTAGQVGDEAVLRVRNPGPDLDPDTIRGLFEPFGRHPGAEGRPEDGAQLGLYVVRRLVEVHGGRLRMTAQDGEIVVEVNLATASTAGTASTASTATTASTASTASTVGTVAPAPPVPRSHPTPPAAVPAQARAHARAR